MRKLRFWATIGRSYSSVFDNLRSLIAVTGIWIVGFVAFSIWFGDQPTYSLPGGNYKAFGMTVTVRGSTNVPPDAAHIAVTIGAFLFVFVGLFASTVAWYRVILLSEKLPFWQTIRFGWRELKFFLYTLALLFILLLFFAAIMWPLAPLFGKAAFGFFMGAKISDEMWLAGLLLLLIYFVIGVVTVRYALVFPALAIDREDPFGAGWGAGHHNTFRLFFGSLIVSLPISVFLWFVQHMLGQVTKTGEAGKALGVTIGVVGGFLEFALVISFIALAFRELEEAPVTE